MDSVPEWAAGLGLEPLAGEGGFFAGTWRSPHTAEPDGFPGQRVFASAIYFLLARGQHSEWHQLRADELWFWHRGAPITLRFGTEPGEATEVVLGPDLEAGQRPQVHIAAGQWQSTRPVTADTLVSCVVTPGFEYADFRLIGD
ncbi:MAG TPA: cupin domain-containing protein [Pseudonocardiaceae bacterium]|nr:cupin domain-containing protein [Pseudonocardiaceae bacterium]